MALRKFTFATFKYKNVMITKWWTKNARIKFVNFQGIAGLDSHRPAKNNESTVRNPRNQ